MQKEIYEKFLIRYIISFRIDYIFCVCWIFLFLLKWGWLYNMYKGETVLVEVKALCISHCNSILIWSDFIQKSFYTFKIRYIERNSIRKKKCFQIQLCTSIFRLHCGIEREKRGVRYSFIYSATSGPSEPVGQRDHASPQDFDRSLNQKG